MGEAGIGHHLCFRPGPESLCSAGPHGAEARIRAEERAACVARMREMARAHRDVLGKPNSLSVYGVEVVQARAEAFVNAAEALSAPDGRTAVLLTTEEARLVRALVDEYAASAERTAGCEGGPVLRALAARFSKEADRG